MVEEQRTVYKVVRSVVVFEENVRERTIRLSAIAGVFPFSLEYRTDETTYPQVAGSLLFGFTDFHWAERFARALSMGMGDRNIEIWRATGFGPFTKGNVCVESTMSPNDISSFWKHYNGREESVKKISPRLPITWTPSSTILCKAMRLNERIAVCFGGRTTYEDELIGEEV